MKYLLDYLATIQGNPFHPPAQIVDLSVVVVIDLVSSIFDLGCLVSSMIIRGTALPSLILVLVLISS